MKLYKSRLVQVLLAVLYAIIASGILSVSNNLSPWVLMVVSLLFCALWANVRYVLLSTGLMVVTTVPVWWLAMAPHQAEYLDILGWYPVIVFNFVIFVLLPEVVVVWGRNAVIRKYVN